MDDINVEYQCDECDIEIRGMSGDPQEAPVLYCPNCIGKRLNPALL